MASINNLMVKNVVNFRGREGDASQGDIYLSGKKLGFWSQDGNGGEDTFEFDENLLKELAEKYKESLSDNFILKKYFDVSMLILQVIELNDFEAIFEKKCKGNGNILIVVDNGIEYSAFTCIDENAKTIKDKIKSLQTKLENSYLGKVDTKVYTFRNKMDFTVVV